MERTGFANDINFYLVAHKDASNTLSKAFFEICEDMNINSSDVDNINSADMDGTFHIGF